MFDTFPIIVALDEAAAITIKHDSSTHISFPSKPSVLVPIFHTHTHTLMLNQNEVFERETQLMRAVVNLGSGETTVAIYRHL